MKRYLRLIDLNRQDLLPKQHVEYLKSIQDINPSVVYDIGACVLHWYNKARLVWPSASFVAFDAVEEAAFLYHEARLQYAVGVLSDQDDRSVDFFYNVEMPGGCSYYRENKKVNPPAGRFYTEQHKRTVKTKTLDTVVLENGFPLPDLIKMDIQGAELDVLRGAPRCLQHAKDVILELQDLDFNEGAPKSEEVVSYMESVGFQCVARNFSKNLFDGDYHFKRM